MYACKTLKVVGYMRKYAQHTHTHTHTYMKYVNKPLEHVVTLHFATGNCRLLAECAFILLRKYRVHLHSPPYLHMNKPDLNYCRKSLSHVECLCTASVGTFAWLHFIKVVTGGSRQSARAKWNCTFPPRFA